MGGVGLSIVVWGSRVEFCSMGGVGLSVVSMGE